MLHREIMAVCSQFHIKHINTKCGLNVELLAVRILTTGLSTAVHGYADASLNIGNAFRTQCVLR